MRDGQSHWWMLIDIGHLCFDFEYHASNLFNYGCSKAVGCLVLDALETMFSKQPT